LLFLTDKFFFRRKIRRARRGHKGLIPKIQIGDKGELFVKLLFFVASGERDSFASPGGEGFFRTKTRRARRRHKGLIPKILTGDKGELFVKLLFFVASGEKGSFCFSLRTSFFFARRHEEHKGGTKG